jgi:hypothetical protein
LLVSRSSGESSVCRWWGVLPQPADRPLAADEVGPTGRAVAVAVVIAFTWLVEAGFKQLLKLF